MDFVNENAIDDNGVSREVYTAFWEQFLETCEGEAERVPRLRPDFCEAEWQAVGRIWVKGLLDHGVMPVRLSKAFILACNHGVDSVDVDILMTSFLNYLSPVERSAVEKALQGTMEESDEEDLLDLFTRMGSHFLPAKNNMEPAIETMAHKAILQEPKYIVDCFLTPMSLVQLKLPDKDSVLSLYEKKKATGRRVSQLFETTNVVLSQREQTTFNHLQRYVKNADQAKAEKILRFCTGSSVICVDRIGVCFNAETGLSRRPVAHTCGAILEIPCTYSSFPEFRTEFDNILDVVLVFLWCLFSSLFVHGAVGLLMLVMLQRHKRGRLITLVLVSVGFLASLSGGVITSAAVAGVYRVAGKDMAPLEALVFGVGQTALSVIISFSRILATL
ncbi:hypothetical protein F7725_025352 [Dissostichus mawsoni]|uniref:HECT domain-containing protein n=1 Tax=Dissostichus mawsoni TaxID=36200 RepID=A0A7J5XCV8_DISMA|nr:hypothetical protein F7725_025352 [Dissostichus mawsoni]